jgi:hypothetical protein
VAYEIPNATSDGDAEALGDEPTACVAGAFVAARAGREHGHGNSTNGRADRGAHLPVIPVIRPAVDDRIERDHAVFEKRAVTPPAVDAPERERD